MNGHETAAENLINNMGFNVTLETKYRVQRDTAIGDERLVLSDTFGLKVGHVLNIGADTVEIASIDRDSLIVDLTGPLSEEHLTGAYLQKIVNTKATSPKARSSNKDLFELTRSIRIAKDHIVNYGSIVTRDGDSFFVTGFNDSDLTYLLKIHLTNRRLSLQRYQDGPFNGFGYDKEWHTLYTGVPAYSEHISSRMDLQESGYNASTYQVITMPEVYAEDLLLTDRILVGQFDKFKIIGFDRMKLRNLLTVIVDYDEDR